MLRPAERVRSWAVGCLPPLLDWAVSDLVWQAERAAFMEMPWPTRSVQRMHLGQYAGYRLQHDLPNPLAQAAAEG